MSRKNKETTIKDLIEIFLPKLWIILLVGVLLAGLMSVYSVFFKKDTYTASAEIYVYRKGSSTPTSTSDIAAAEEMVNIYARAIGGDKFMDQVRVKLFEKNNKYEYTTSQLKRMISLTKVEDAPNFIIRVTTGSPELSADLAYVIVDEGIAGGVLEGIIENNLASSVFEDPKDAKSIKANSKNTLRNAVIAFFAGLILAAVCVWIFASSTTAICIHTVATYSHSFKPLCF